MEALTPLSAGVRHTLPVLEHVPVFFLSEHWGAFGREASCSAFLTGPNQEEVLHSSCSEDNGETEKKTRREGSRSGPRRAAVILGETH